MAKVKKALDLGITLKPDDVAFDGIEGELKVGATSKKLHAYLDAASRAVVTENQSQSLTNKTVVVASNTITTAASGNLVAVELNAALSELQTDIDTRATSTALTDHINDISAAHAASAVSNTPSGNLAATDQQAVNNELQSDIDTRALSSDLTNHINDTTDAHDASAVSVVVSGNLASTDAQSAFVELQGDIDTINTTLANKVTGPASATDEAIVRYDLTTGKLVQDSLVTITDAGILGGATQLNVDNTRLDGNTLSSTDTNGNLNLVPNGTGEVDVQKDLRIRQDLHFDSSNDTATGSNATLTAPATKIIRLTSGTLASIDMIPAGSAGQTITLTNATGTAISLNNNTGATTANRILTGSGASLAMPDESSIDLVYDSTETRWMAVGISGSASSSTVESYKITNLGIAATVAANAMTIAIKTDSGTDATALDKISVGFRSATSGTGQFTTVDITGALSTVISSGSTAGQANAESAYIYVYLINNAGAAEVAWSRVALDEGSIVTTTAEGGAGAADSASTVYSTTARTGVPIRLVGRLLNTQTTAGTWAAAPSEISLVPFDSQIISSKYLTTAGQSLVNNSNIVFGAKVWDTHNAYNTSTGVFTAPDTGYYEFNVGTRVAATSQTAGSIYGVRVTQITTGLINFGNLDTSFSTTSRNYTGSLITTFFMTKNDTAAVRFNTDLSAATMDTASSVNFLTIKRVGF